MPLVRLALVATLALLAAPALAQPSAGASNQPPPDPVTAPSDPIVVTGARSLVVNIESVAQRCAACLRALGRIQALVDTPRRGDPPRSVEQVTARPPRDDARSPVDVTTASARGMMIYSEVMTRSRLTRDSGSQPAPLGSVDTQVERLFRNLLRYIGPIVDRQIAERSAPAAYASDDPAVRNVATIDITDAVVEALDRDHADVDLLARPLRNR